MNFNYLGIEGFDVSLYQDNNTTPQKIDFDMMRNWGADFAIIRAGQNLWADPDFGDNWYNAKLAGIPRAAYWFYDPRISPIKQAELFASLFRNDPPEGRLWIDLEYPASWGGQFTHWTDWRTMIEETARLSGLRIGIYTADWWWSTQVIGDYAYFGKYPLWVAQYTGSPADVKLPRGWTACLIWQDGTPPIGREVGCESLEVDHNKFNGDAADFLKEFGNTPTIPETPTGGTMKGTMLNYTVNVRNAASAIVAALKVNDVVYGEVTGTRPRINFDTIHRADGSVQNLGAMCNAVTTDGGSVAYMTLTPETTPPPPPPTETAVIDRIDVTVNGVKYFAVNVPLTKAV